MNLKLAPQVVNRSPNKRMVEAVEKAPLRLIGRPFLHQLQGELSAISSVVKIAATAAP